MLLFFLRVRRNLQELIIKPVLVANSVVLLQARDQLRIVLKDHVLQNASLVVVQDTLFGHFGDNGEEHARLGPHVRRQDPIRVVVIGVTTARLLGKALLSVGCHHVIVHG